MLLLLLPVVQERVAQAESEYLRGVRNLKAAASDLQSLSSQVRSSEKGARGERGREGGRVTAPLALLLPFRISNHFLQCSMLALCWHACAPAGRPAGEGEKTIRASDGHVASGENDSHHG